VDTTAFEIAERFETGSGHRYFKAASGPRTGQWAVADWSGSRPWNTDDGVLWVVPGQFIEVGDEIGALDLEKDGRQGPERTRTPLGPAEAVIVAFRLGLPIQIKGQRAYTVVEYDPPPCPAMESGRRCAYRAGHDPNHPHRFE